MKLDINEIKRRAGLEFLAEADKKEPPSIDKDFGELFDEHMDNMRIHNFEGERGVRNFEKIVAVLGYRSIDDFLADNSGCFEAMIEWIKEWGERSKEWKQSVQDAIDAK